MCWYLVAPRTVVGAHHRVLRTAPPIRALSVFDTRVSLLDEQVRFVLAATAEAMAATPGRLYPLVYVGPLGRPDLLADAASEAARAFGIAFSVWSADTGAAAGGGIVLCRSTEIRAATRNASASTQVIAWGDLPADLPPDVRSEVLRSENLVLDLNACDVWSGRMWSSSSFGLGTLSGEPLLLVAPRKWLRLHADHALLLLESAGVRSVAVPVWETQGAGHHGIVTVWTVDTGFDAADVARLISAARASRQALVVVTDEESCASLRSNPAWSPDLSRIRRVLGSAGPSICDLPWPNARSVWVGGPVASGAETITMPEGTTLLEALGLLEVRCRPGRLVAWRPDAVAVISVAARPSGAVVVSAGVVGGDLAIEREAVLEVLDAVRGWAGARLAVIWGLPPAASSSVEEPVQRVGFHFSRLDDERGGGNRPEAGRDAMSMLSAEGVARTLVALGLSDDALRLLRTVERESQWGVGEEMLLGFLIAELDPHEAITRLRHAAVRLANGSSYQGAWELQTDATLNALLLLVRTNQVPAVDAWATVAAWLERAGLDWVATPRHAAVLFELAARAGRPADAKRFAALFRSTGGAEDDGLAAAMEPVLRAVIGCDS